MGFGGGCGPHLKRHERRVKLDVAAKRLSRLRLIRVQAEPMESGEEAPFRRPRRGMPEILRPAPGRGGRTMRLPALRVGMVAGACVALIGCGDPLEGDWQSDEKACGSHR